MKILKLTFDIVGRTNHPEHYCTAHGEHPFSKPHEIPEEDWTTLTCYAITAADTLQLLAQWADVTKMAAGGVELIRNPVLWKADVGEWHPSRLPHKGPQQMP